MKNLRQRFLQFFQQHKHQIMAPSPVVQNEGDSTLFTIAGMKQFAHVFLGTEKPPHPRVTTIQPCIRLGGKQNDLENVGYTKRHATFFEMCGNFSFGDYFKEEAITMAYNFLQELMPGQQFYHTVYGHDEESYQLWSKLVPKERIIKLFTNDNFWFMGDTGPCGACTEIYIDTQPHQPLSNPIKAIQDGRLLELWNLVFMEFEKVGPIDNYNFSLVNPPASLKPLQKKSVDTGMGLERLWSALNQTFDIFDIPILLPILEEATKITDNLTHAKIVADHMRSAAFIINENILPSSTHQGYCLRKLIRRSMSLSNSSLIPVIKKVIATIHDTYDLNPVKIITVVREEEELFREILAKGKTLLEKEQNIDENFIFKLQDTHGFPYYIAQHYLQEKHINLNFDKVKTLIEHSKKNTLQRLDYNKPVKMLCYDTLEVNSSIKFIEDKKDHLLIITDQTPFYPRGGGQKGDQGWLITSTAIADVFDTTKYNLADNSYVIVHHVKIVKGTLALNDIVQLVVNPSVRAGRARAHTATHLLYDLLKKHDPNLQQSGSSVDSDSFHLDIKSPPLENIDEINHSMNHIIQQNLDVETHYEQKENIKHHLLFNEEKYGTQLRMIKIRDISYQACGGTHVKKTGEIKKFIITSESSIKAGIRRIEAVTGPKVEEFLNQKKEEIKKNSVHLEIKTHENFIVLKTTNAAPADMLKLLDNYKNHPNVIITGENKGKQQIILYSTTLNLEKINIPNFQGKIRGNKIQGGLQKNIPVEEIIKYVNQEEKQ